MKYHLNFLFFLSPLFLFAQKKNLDHDLTAVHGYDLVTYYTLERPLKGKKQFEVIWEGAHYWFANYENKAAFEAAPEKFLPAYGGWCAYAMARGKEVEINPMAYHLQQGQLLLFYKTNWVDTKAKWIKEEKDYKAKADKNWAAIRAKSNE